MSNHTIEDITPKHWGHELDVFSNLTPEEWFVLEQRARNLSRTTDQSDAALGEMIQVMTFQLASETYAAHVENVRLVQPLKRLTRVPWTPDFVVGVINLRGNLLSLIDIRKFFGIAGQEITDLMKFIVVEAGDISIGIVANRVDEVCLMPRDSFTDAPATINGIDAEFIEGVTGDGLILLDLDALLRDPRMIVDNTSL
jgi:purine-binding chemotaxis protein CheW